LVNVANKRNKIKWKEENTVEEKIDLTFLWKKMD